MNKWTAVAISTTLIVAVMAAISAISDNWSSFVDASWGAALGAVLYVMFWQEGTK